MTFRAANFLRPGLLSAACVANLTLAGSGERLVENDLERRDVGPPRFARAPSWIAGLPPL